MKDCTSIKNALEMHPSNRNGGPMAVIMNKYFKSSLCDDCKECEEQVGDQLVANEDAIEMPTEYDGRVEKFYKDGRHPKRRGVHLENDGRITFYPKTKKNGPM